MSHILRAISILVAFTLAACGSIPIEDPDSDTSTPPRLLFPGPSADRTPPDYKADLPNPTLPQEGRLLAPIPSQLYFAPLVGHTPLPDVVSLRAIGTQPVAILRIALLDNPDSPFGAGAGEHFAWSLLPERFDVLPGERVMIEVRYLADVYGMQAALLEIRTDSENLPFIRVQLTGKVIEL